MNVALLVLGVANLAATCTLIVGLVVKGKQIENKVITTEDNARASIQGIKDAVANVKI